MDASTPKYITLSQLQSLVKRELERAFPVTYWIVAEVGEVKVNYSGHCYMQLVEKGGRKEQPQAAASAVVWRSAYGSIASYFRSQTGGDITAGMKLLLRVSVSYHELYGLSLVVSDIDPSYTLGDLEQQRRQTIARLQQEGVFDMNRELPMPVFIQRVAVISSRNAAGYQDFMQEIAFSDYCFHVTLFDAFMQGDGAEASIIAALDAVAGDFERYDAVVVIRGGGSQSDLSCFNAYRLCAHIAQFPLPVITGIGHDKDRSVADMVAALDLRTPTAVASFLVELMMQEDGMLNAAKERLVQYAKGIIDSRKKIVTQYGQQLAGIVSGLTRTLELHLGELSYGVAHHSLSQIKNEESRTALLRVALEEKIARQLTKNSSQLDLMASRVSGYDPRRILSLGFAVVRNRGRIIKDSSELTFADSINITLHKGTINANVETTE